MQAAGRSKADSACRHQVYAGQAESAPHGTQKTSPGQGLLPPGSGQRQLLLAVHFSLGLLSLSHTITGNIQLNNDAVMHQAVNGCRRGHRVFKNTSHWEKGRLLVIMTLPRS